LTQSKPTTAIVPRESALPAQFDPANLSQASELANMLAKSSLLPTALRGKPEDVLVTMLTGRELGLSTMQSIRGISVIEGKGTLNADLKVGLVLSHPEVCLYFQLIESTDEKATYETHRKGNQTPTRMSFTIEQAKKAGLVGKSNWQKYQAAMLRARCSSALATAIYPDLVAGIYTDDEADDIRASARASQVETKAAARGPTIEGEIVPSHDPLTGEVVSEAAENEADLLTAIASAPTPEVLKALVPRFQTLDNATKDRLRAAYLARQKALRAAAEPAPKDEPPPADDSTLAREPGSDG
jgi:hypothetical protein